MRIKKIITLLLVATIVVVLVACNSNDQETTTTSTEKVTTTGDYHYHYVMEESIPPTCVETGYYRSYCKICGQELHQEVITPALGHTPVIDEEVPPTPTETGLTEGSHCSVCGAIIVNQEKIRSINDLRDAYPEYIDLSPFKGLEVYVCQFAPENYSFSLVEGTNRNKSMWELMELKGVSAKEMRDILSTYDIDDEYIVVVPWQNPYSSYIGEYHAFLVGEDEEAIEKQKKAYIEKVRDMLGLE